VSLASRGQAWALQQASIKLQTHPHDWDKLLGVQEGQDVLHELEWQLRNAILNRRFGTLAAHFLVTGQRRREHGMSTLAFLRVCVL
jgi:hypothetical protein